MIATSRTTNTPKSQIAGTIQRPRDSGTYEISVTAAAKNSHPRCQNYYSGASITEITRNCTQVRPFAVYDSSEQSQPGIYAFDIVPRAEKVVDHAHARTRTHTHGRRRQALTQRQGGVLSRQERGDFPQARTHSWFTSRGERRQQQSAPCRVESIVCVHETPI